MRSEDFAGPSAHRMVGGVGRTIHPMLDSLCLRAFASALQRTSAGRLRITMPSGRSAVIGHAVTAGTDPGGDAKVVVHSYSALWKIFRRGLLGFADSYISGEIETESLHNLFNYYVDNEMALAKANRRLQRSSRHDRWFHSRRANTRTGSRRNIAAHYDLGNDFYRLWLDPGLTYSSGIYARPGMSLTQAQAEKYARILAALDFAPGDTLLEIGCGWGAFAEAAAARGAAITAITLSRQQFEDASARMARLGFAECAEIRLEDYRDTTGTFSRLASIEMIEAVGEDNWPTYFQVISDRLQPGGTAVLQAITIRPDLFDAYRNNPDFIQRYIFPGGMLPTIEAMEHHAQEAGLGFERLERFGPCYARTLADWRVRFNAAWPKIEALRFDDRFRRMWTFYFAYCEVGFERGMIDVGLFRLRKPGAQACPPIGDMKSQGAGNHFELKQPGNGDRRSRTP